MNRPRDRASAAGLLPRMEARPHKDGTTVSYRYHPVGGKPVPLGTDRDQAIRKVLDMNGRGQHHGSLRWLWEQWQTSKRYLKLGENTKADYALAWKQIDKVLGDYPAGSITAPRIAQYMHLDRAEAGRRADIEKTVLSSLFKHGIMAGVCLTNPTVGVEPRNEEPNRVMPETAAIKAFVEWLAKQGRQRKILGLMAEYAAAAGNRRCEFLDIVWMQVDLEAGEVRTKRAKQRGAKRGEVIEIVEITPRLRSVLDRVKALEIDGLYLFPTEDGNAYTDRGWKSLWQRAMTEAIEDKVITAKQRFNFHALRRYFATFHKSKYDKLPDLHANPAVTASVYDATTEVRRKAL